MGRLLPLDIEAIKVVLDGAPSEDVIKSVQQIMFHYSKQFVYLKKQTNEDGFLVLEFQGRSGNLDHCELARYLMRINELRTRVAEFSKVIIQPSPECLEKRPWLKDWAVHKGPEEFTNLPEMEYVVVKDGPEGFIYVLSGGYTTKELLQSLNIDFDHYNRLIQALDLSKKFEKLCQLEDLKIYLDILAEEPRKKLNELIVSCCKTSETDYVLDQFNNDDKNVVTQLHDDLNLLWKRGCFQDLWLGMLYGWFLLNEGSGLEEDVMFPTTKRRRLI